MSVPEQISEIHRIVSGISIDVAVIKERDQNTEKRINSHAGKITAIETMIQSFQLEKAKLGFASKLAVIGLSFLGTILGGTAIGVFVFYITKSF